MSTAATAGLQNWSKPPKKQSPLWTALSDEQRLGAWFSLTRDGSGLFYEQGVGKTWIPLAALEQSDDETALFIVPLTNKETSWADSIDRWMPDWQVFTDWGAFKAATGKRILLYHIDILRRRRDAKGRRKGVIDKIAKFKWDLVVIDEAQKLKARASEQSRIARKLRLAKRRIALTGTPMDKQPTDLWAIMRFINVDVFGDSWPEFDREYLEQPTVDPKEFRRGSMRWHRAMLVQRIQRGKPTIREDRLQRFYSELKPWCLRITKEVLNLPPSRNIPVEFDLFGEQRRIYESLERHSLATVEGRVTKAALAITRNVKLQQITGGFMIEEDGGTSRVGNAKARAFRRILPKLRRPFVVFCKHLEDMDIVAEIIDEFGLTFDLLYGGVKDTKNNKARTNLIRKFQAEQLDALIVQQKTGGVGVDLYAAADAVFWSWSHSWIDFDQARARIERRGQLRDMRFYLLIARNTIDEDKWMAIKEKKSITAVVLDRLTL
jgi:SNF2 family DNA or RNA helicase